MLKISREADLGLLLMVELSKFPAGKTIGLKTLAKEKGLPYRFLSKMAVKLKKAGLLKSREGREGGYRLARKAKEIKVGEVMRALEGPVAAVRCLQGIKCEAEGFCQQKKLMSKLSKTMSDQLNKVSLEELC